jgi:hypothetical protein
MHAMEDLFSPILLGVFFIATFSICLCGFSIVMVRTRHAHLCNFSSFLFSFVCLSVSAILPCAYLFIRHFLFPRFIFIVYFIYFAARYLSSFSYFLSYLVCPCSLSNPPNPNLRFFFSYVIIC